MKKRIWVVVIIVVVFIFAGVLINKKPEEVGEIRVGAVLPLTGGAALSGVYYKNGMEFAAEEFDIDIEFQDGKAVPADSLNAAQHLVNSGHKIILTSFRGASISVASNFKDRDDVIIFSTTATSDEKPIGDYGLNFFAIGAEMISNGFVLGEYAKEICNNAATLTEISDAGKDKVSGFSSGFGKAKISLHEEFPNDKSDFRDLVTKIKGTNPDCIFIEIKSNYFKNFLDQLSTFNLKPKIFTTSYSVNNDVIRSLNNEQKNAVIMSSTSIYPDDKIQKAYEKKYGQPMNDFSLVGYEMVRMIYLSQKGCFGENTNVCLTNNLRKIKDLDSGLGKIGFDNHQEIKLKDNNLYKISDDGFVPIK
jgi:branched-chain amino acid transport system substrate-binding protein